jgi:hypothetical protein
MKKIIIIAAMLLGFAVAASAQPRAIGIRNAGISYQHSVGADFIEAGIGLYGTAFSVEGVYNIMLAQPSWTSRGEWGFYAGPGANVGLGNKLFNVAVVGQVGLEYTFWFPLQLSLDVRPQVGFASAAGVSSFYMGGFYPALGVRYRF